MRKEVWLRFKVYACKLASNRLLQGEVYSEMKPVYQIVLANYVPKGYQSLIQCFRLRDEMNIMVKIFIYV